MNERRHDTGDTAGHDVARKDFLGTVGKGAGAVAAAGILQRYGATDVFAAPSPRLSPASTPTTVIYGAYQAPDTLDPGVTGLAASSRILYQIFEPLVWQLAGSTTILPGLATSWHVSPDAKVYTFKLRTGVQFHDGTPFDAHAVKFTFDHIVDPATKSLSAVSALGPYSHTVVVDSHTVQVVFTQPYAPFLNLLSGVILAPVSPTAVKKYGADFGNHPVGTGPFMVQEYVTRDHVTLVRNPHYTWAPAFYGRQGPAALGKIIWRIIPDDSTRMGTLETGETNIVEYLIPQEVARFKAKAKYKVLFIDAPGSPRVIMLNVAKAPTNELAVRQAMIYAVDQKAIVNAFFKGVYLPAYTPLEPSTLGYNPALATMYPFDPAKAKQLLDKAGWTVGSNGMRQRHGVPLKPLFINQSGDQFDQVAQTVQAYMRQVGIDLQLTDQSNPTIFATYNKGPQNLSEIFYWYNDPSLLYSLYASSQIKSGFNWGHYANAQVDRLLAQGAATADQGKRQALYRQAQQIIMRDAVIIPIQQKRTVIAHDATLQGLRFTSVTYPLLYTVR